MNRRSLLKSLSTLPLLGFLSRFAVAAVPTPKPVPSIEENAIQEYIDALRDNQAQAHYFLCHGINGHPSMTDDGTCLSWHCTQARKVLAKMGPHTQNTMLVG